MRSLLIFLVAIVIIGAVLAPIESSEAGGVAEVYFFNEDGDCIAQVYLIPGDKIGNKLPPLSSVKGWYDEEAQRITAGSTFDAGSHIIKEHSSVTPPEPPESPPDNSGAIIGIVAAIIAVLAIGTVAWVLIKK